MGAAAGLVLVVEDEVAIATVIGMYLTCEGFGVQAVTDGAAALAADRRCDPRWPVRQPNVRGVFGRHA